MKIIILSLLPLLLASGVRADELRLTKAQASALGYRPVTKKLRKSAPLPPPFPRHGLAWPVPFQSDTLTIANSMAQYQEYGDNEPYWHGGGDLRTARGAWVTAPIGGHLYGGHYSYVTNADGSSVKHMLPWPQVGRALYLEISITTPDGHRLEFHHVDRATLTPEVVALLNRGGGPVAAGTRLGQVIDWPMEKPAGESYHHIHYNIITPDEKELNPEWYSPLIADSTPPTIHGVYARFGTIYEKLTEGATLKRRPDELIVANTDLKDGNVYVQPADYIAAKQGDKKIVLWDLRQRLLTPEGQFPAIREHYLETMRVGGRTLRTQGNYSRDLFLSRLRLKDSITGEVQLQVMDQASNLTEFKLTLP